MAKKGTTRKRSSKATKTAKKENLKKANSRGKSSSSSNGHGGAREGAGRKTNEEKKAIEILKERAVNFAVEETEINVTTAHGMKVVKMTRDLAVLNMLFTEAVARKNVAAAREFFDRTRGKAVQPVEMDGTIKVEDQYVPEEDIALQAALAAYHATALELKTNGA